VCLAALALAGIHAYGLELHGRLIDGGVPSYDGFVIELANMVNRDIRQRADALADGSFFVRDLPDGDYEVKVTTLYGEEVVMTFASIGPAVGIFEIRLPQSKLQKPISGTISIQQLNHPPSKQVRKLLESGHRLLDGQHYEDAAAHFREAAEDAPNCAQARADLGLALAKLRDWDGAVKEYRAAAALEPRNSMIHSNLGAALASSNHLEEAEREAAMALKLDPRNARAHYILAGILLQRPDRLKDAMAHLRTASEAIPTAKSALEKICAANRLDGCP
jgi:Flp pilus assembly protein TadD